MRFPPGGLHMQDGLPRHSPGDREQFQGCSGRGGVTMEQRGWALGVDGAVLCSGHSHHTTPSPGGHPALPSPLLLRLGGIYSQQTHRRR